MSCDEFIITIRKGLSLIKIKNNYIDVIKENITFLCSQYIFVENDIIKNDIIKKCCEDINDENILKIIKYILMENIIVDEVDNIFTQWILIGNVLKQKKFLLNKKENQYELIFLKEECETTILQLIK